VLRHDIAALTREERTKLSILPLPPLDTLPMTWEEKAVLCADASLFLSHFGEQLWRERDCAAKGLLEILRVSLEPYTAEPIELTHPVLRRANGLMKSLIQYVEPDWLLQA
jgi:hypothetical protein